MPVVVDEPPVGNLDIPLGRLVAQPVLRGVSRQPDILRRDELDVVPDDLLEPVGPFEGADQLEGDADPGKALEGVIAVGAQRIDDRAGVGKLVAAFMVVRNDEVDAERAPQRDLLDGGHAAVDRDYERHAAGGDVRHRLVGEPVALCKALGDLDVAFKTLAAQVVRHGRRGGKPVDVVVAEDGDVLFSLYGEADAVDGSVHIAHPEGIVQKPEIVAQQLARLGGGGASAGGHDERQKGGEPGLSELAGLVLETRIHVPVFHCHGSRPPLSRDRAVSGSFYRIINIISYIEPLDKLFFKPVLTFLHK